MAQRKKSVTLSAGIALESERSGSWKQELSKLFPSQGLHRGQGLGTCGYQGETGCCDGVEDGEPTTMMQYKREILTI